MSASNTETPNPRPLPAESPDNNVSVKEKLGESGSALKHSAQAAASKATEIASRARQSAKHQAASTEADAEALLAEQVRPGNAKLLLKTGAAAAVSTAAVLAAVWLWRHRAQSQEDGEDYEDRED